MEQDANAGYLISWPRREQEQDLIQVRYRSESRRDGGAAFPAWRSGEKDDTAAVAPMHFAP